MRKKSTIRKNASVWCFPSRLDQTVTTCSSNRSKMHSKSFFSHSCPEILLNFYPLKCTHLGISLFQFYKLLVRKNEFETWPIRSWQQCRLPDEISEKIVLFFLVTLGKGHRKFVIIPRKVLQMGA